MTFTPLVLLASILAPTVLAQAANFQTSNSRAIVLNSVTDFCLYGPQVAGSTIGDTEPTVVGFCLNNHGTRSIPEGTIQSAHFIETPNYVQISGRATLTNINVAAGDAGGELDPHGATNEGNPIGGTVTVNGVQSKEWHMFIGNDLFCVRACKNAGDDYLWCQHIYDLQGCFWNDPGNYGGGFDQCLADSTVTPPGIYISNGVTSTYQQGDGSNPAPPAHAAGASSQCRAVASVGGGNFIAAPPAATAAATTTPAAVVVAPTTAAPRTTTPAAIAGAASSSSSSSTTLPSLSILTTAASSSASMSRLSETPSNSSTAVRSIASTSAVALSTTRAVTAAAASTSTPASSGTKLGASVIGAFVAGVAGLFA